MTSTVASATHVGRRKYNQDTIVAKAVAAADGPVRLLGVLDGMGGMRAGDRASQLAAEVLVKSVEKRLVGRPADEGAVRAALLAAVAEAHDAVLQEGLAEQDKRGMGTTLVAVVERGGRFLVVNVGDSRAYLYEPAAGVVRRLTRDHSLREEAVRLGKLTVEQARNSPYAHALTRAVGSGPPPEADLFPEPSGWFELPAGGVLLLCSDGMTGALDDARIAELIAGAPAAAGLADRLLRAAYHAGSNDNITVLTLADQAFRSVNPSPPPPPIDGEEETPPTLARGADLPPPDLPPPPSTSMITVAAVAIALVLLFLLFMFFRPLPRPLNSPLPSPPPPRSSPPPANPPDEGGMVVDLTPAANGL